MTTNDEATTSNRKRSLMAVIASMVVVNLVYGLTLPLLSLVLDSQGINKTVIGLSIMVQASAGVVLAPVLPRLIYRLGAARAMQYATVVAALTLVALGLARESSLLFPLRFLLGGSAAMLWSASEIMINELADDDWRGRIIGIYGSAGAAGFALGPLLLVMTGSAGMLPFIVPAAFIVIAGLPLVWLSNERGTDKKKVHASLMHVFKLVPYIMLLNLTYAATVEAFVAFFPLFGIHIGLGEALSLSLLTTFALGGVFLQLPLGWLADHMNRHTLLLMILLVTIVGFALMPGLIGLPLAGPVFAFTLGGIESMVYVLGIILLGQRFRGAELAAASVLYTSMWGTGMMIGPMLVGIGMDVFGNASMPYLIAAIYVCYLPVLLFRRR